MPQGWPRDRAHDGSKGVPLQVDQACPGHVQHRVRLASWSYLVPYFYLQGPGDSWTGQSLLEADPSCQGKGESFCMCHFSQFNTKSQSLNSLHFANLKIERQVVEGAGHFLQESHGEELADNILHFLKNQKWADVHNGCVPIKANNNKAETSW